MNKGININVSGGGVSIGAVSQGDAGQVSGSAALSQTVIAQESERAVAAITSLAREQGRSDDELRTVLDHLEKLKVASLAASKDSQDAGGLLKLVRENFSWAYPAVKYFAKAVWPALLTLIGT